MTVRLWRGTPADEKAQQLGTMYNEEIVPSVGDIVYVKGTVYKVTERHIDTVASGQHNHLTISVIDIYVSET